MAELTLELGNITCFSLDLPYDMPLVYYDLII